VGVQVGVWIRIVSLIPEFELGLWNAWIFVLIFFLINVVFSPLHACIDENYIHFLLIGS